MGRGQMSIVDSGIPTPRPPALYLVPRTGALTAEKDMCVSCGNCSTYCEMGIDVRAYAMATLERWPGRADHEGSRTAEGASTAAPVRKRSLAAVTAGPGIAPLLR